MTDDEFDRSLLAAVFASIGRDGWQRLSIPGAAQAAGLGLARARARLPTRTSVLTLFGSLADQAALGALAEGAEHAPVQERLFDMLMRRIDLLQLHRDGVKALLAALPTDPPTAIMLAAASLASMRWLLDAALARAAQVARSIPGFQDDPAAPDPAQADLFVSDTPPDDPPAPVS